MAIVVLIFTSVLSLTAAIFAVLAGAGLAMSFGLYLFTGLILPLGLISFQCRTIRGEKMARHYGAGII